MSLKCKHRWQFRVSQDGLLYLRFCSKCCICEYLDQDCSMSTMRVCEAIPEGKDLMKLAARGLSREELARFGIV